MKKILLATTVLVGFAGVASAEVTLSGDARMGIQSIDGGDAAFSSRARVKFTMSGETDGGLAFGASFRAADAGNAASGEAGSVSISGAFGKVEMGDLDQADLAIVGNISGVGYTGIEDLNELYYNSSKEDSAPVAAYTYSAGDLTVGVSTDVNGEEAAIAAAYTMGDYKIAAGIDKSDGDANQLTLGASAKFGAAVVKAIYQKSGYEGGDSYTSIGASVDYTVDALTATAFYMDDEWDNSPAYGVGASYDLGGGAAAVAGYSHQDGDAGSYDAGVTFSF